SESRQKGLVVDDKGERVFHFHHNTLHALAEMIAAAGLSHPDEIEAHHVVRRFSATEIKTYAQTLFFLKRGELLNEPIDSHFYRENWHAASSATFARVQS